MAWNLTPPVEGDAIVSTDVQSEMTAAENTVNALPVDALAQRALNYHHLPSLLVASGSEYQTSSSDYDCTTAYPGWDTLAGWQRLDIDGGANEITLSANVDLSEAGIDGLEVEASVLVKKIYDAGGATADASLFAFLFCVQVQDTGGTWHHIARTERFVCGRVDAGPTATDCWRRPALKTLITSDDVGATKTVNKVRLVGSVEYLDSTAVPTGTLTAALRASSLSAFAIQAGGS